MQCYNGFISMKASLNKQKYLALTILITLFPKALCAQTIAEICHNRRSIDIVHKLNQADDAVCKLMQIYKDNQAITKPASDAHEILSLMENKQQENLKIDGKDFRFKHQPLIDALDELAKALQNQAANEAGLGPETETGTAVQEFIEKYSELEYRKSHRQEYIKALENIIGMTELGRNVMEEYHHPTATISGDKPVFIDELPENKRPPESTSKLKFEPDPKDPSKLIRTMFFDIKSKPQGALIDYVHEMTHGIDKRLEEFNFKENAFLQKWGKEDSLTLKKVFSNHMYETQHEQMAQDETKTMILSEIRAYHTGMEFFKELAGQSPRLMCNYTFYSEFYGGQVITIGEEQALIEKSIHDGTFVQFLIPLYIKLGYLKPKYTYLLDNNGNPAKDKDGNFMLRGDLQRAIAKESKF